MALGCGQVVDLQVAASETSSMQSSSQKTRNQEPRLGLLLLFDNGNRGVISEYDKALCACDG